MEVLTNENNPFTLKLIIAANFANKKIDLKIFSSKDGGIPEPKHLPCLIVGDRNLFVANAAAHLLYPPETTENNVSEEWLEWESTVLVPKLINNLVSCGKTLKTSLNACLRVLNDFIGVQAETHGINVSDIAIWSTLYPLYKDPVLHKEYLGDLNYLLVWLQRLERKPQFEAALQRYKITPGIGPYQVLQNSAKYFIIDDIALTPQHSIVESPVTPEELSAVRDSWLNGVSRIPIPKKQTVPVLPVQGEKNVLITSALPYVNNVPHLGNIIGCVLSGDVFARFSRLCNYNTLYICGTDEYGTATETKALEEGLTPQQICDKYFEVHNAIYRWFNIGFDYFGRTSTPEHTKITQEIFLDLNNNGFTQTQAVEQLLCQKCNRFLADRFVEGGCPHIGCNYTDARGDQCDGCGKLVNATELRNPKCKVCGTTPVVTQSSQFFLDLPKLEPLVYHWMDKSSVNWTNNSRIIAKSWIKEGLKPRCITRDLKWGVPVPMDGFREKVFYVWFDAPIGYISITARYTKEWEKWWKPSDNTTISLYQYMAKDNVPFHSVMFPAVLLGMNKGYTMVSHLMACEYLNYEDGKFSKSRGIGVFGNDAQNTGIPSDVWRFYLLYVRPESQDSSFSWSDLATKNNSELLNNLGNFVNRAQVFAQKFFNGVVPTMTLNDDDNLLLALCTRELKQYIKALEKSKLRDGIRHILAISKHGNQYMQASEPWVLIKGTDEEKERAGTIIGVCCNITHLLSTLLFPYLPDTSRNLRQQLNASGNVPILNPERPEIVMQLSQGHLLGKPSPLFSKIEPEQVEELKRTFAGKQNVTKIEKPVVENKSVEKITKDVQVNGIVDPKEVKNLQEAVDAQALLVRELKSSGAAKADWQPQVNILLELKSKLSLATGDAPAKPSAGKKGKK